MLLVIVVVIVVCQKVFVIADSRSYMKEVLLQERWGIPSYMVVLEVLAVPGSMVYRPTGRYL
jgi:hypothetical protein